MSILDELGQLSAAEDFFALLGVPFEPRIVHVARLHILRRMGQYLRGEDFSGMSEDKVRDACRACLEQAYQDFTQSSPIEQRLFKVHQDAIKPKEPEEPMRAFVPLSALTVRST
ncbi:MAG: nitrogenase stabilizing/protective protein NifW [Beijerinckiaceae bacterium]